MRPTWNVWRWFRDGAAVPPGPPPATAPDWSTLAAREAASGHHLRCRAVPDDDVSVLADLVARHVGVALGAEAVARLLAAEWAALAATRPGAAPVEPAEPTLAALLAAEGADRDAIVAWAEGSGDGPEPVGARSGLVRVGGALAVGVVTAGTNWLPRPPLPAAFYGVERPPVLADADPVDRPYGWRHHLAALAEAPAAWRIDAWFEVLGRFGPLAVVLDLGAADEPVFTAAIAGTPFAEALALTLGEKLALEGVEPGASAAVAGLVGHLGLDDADLGLFRAGRDWLAGEVDPSRAEVRAALVDPLRRGILAGGDVGPVLGRAGRVGGEALLGRLRDELVRDGTLSAGEWEALSRSAAAG